jgi:transposase-like protein
MPKRKKGRKRRIYTDEFRAAALAALDAEGGMSKPGSIPSVAKQLDMPESTLWGWAKGRNNPPPSNLRTLKSNELSNLIKKEIGEILEDMPGKRTEADYKAMGTVLGIMVDKLQLLTGKPTEISEEVEQVTFDLSGLTDEQLNRLASWDDASSKETSED